MPNMLVSAPFLKGDIQPCTKSALLYRRLQSRSPYQQAWGHAVERTTLKLSNELRDTPCSFAYKARPLDSNAEPRAFIAEYLVA